MPKSIRFSVAVLSFLARPSGWIPSAHSQPANAASPAANSASPSTQQLDTVNVAADRYKPLTFDLPTSLGFLSLPQMPGAQFPNLKFAFNVMDTMLVTATRAPQRLERVSVSFRLLNADTLRQSPSATLAGALRSVPGFSLFRRSDSFTANPTAQ